MEALIVSLQSVWNDSGFEGLTSGNVIMLLVGLILLYLAIGKGFEPLLLSNIAFGCLLGNIPKTGFFDEPAVRCWLTRRPCCWVLLPRAACSYA